MDKSPINNKFHKSNSRGDTSKQTRRINKNCKHRQREDSTIYTHTVKVNQGNETQLGGNETLVHRINTITGEEEGTEYETQKTINE